MSDTQLLERVAESSVLDIRDLPRHERSTAENLAILDKPARAEVLAAFTELQARALLHDWEFWSRPDQKPPPEFAEGTAKVWYVKAGRGYGKTRTGAETTRKRVRDGRSRRIGFVGPTAGDVRDVMIEGESGLLSLYERWERPHYEPSKRRITFHNGAVGTTYSADEPDRLRGPQHDFVWGDEPASWRYGEDAWDQIELGLRLGKFPQALLTGTPKPIKWLRKLTEEPDTVVTTGSSYRNRANLAPSFIERIFRKYEGTRLGLQELHAQFLEDVEGALWTRLALEETRLTPVFDDDGDVVAFHVPGADPATAHMVDIVRIVVAVDPSGSSTGDEAGIVVCAKDSVGHGYVLADYSLQASPDEWGQQAIDALDLWGADRIVAERNYGAEMVESVIRNIRRNVSFKDVHAKRGKRTRAEPVSQLWEQKRAHLGGIFADLEDELVGTVFDGSEDSPNRLDAMVYGLTDLLVMPKRKVRVRG